MQLTKTCALAVLALSATCALAQSGPGSGILYASDFNAWTLPQANTPTAGMIQWPSAAICHVSSNGFSFVAVKVGRPLTVVDVDPTLTETVTPVAVTTSGGSCTVTAIMAHTHLSYYVQSGTFGLQEAIDYASGKQGGAVVVTTPAWAVAGGVTSTITSATGVAAVSILDQRVATLCAYGWNGSAYAAVGCSTQGSTITGVTAGTAITGGGISGDVTVNVDATKVPLLASPNTFAQPITAPSGVIGNVTGNVSGNATSITGNIIESQVTGLAADLAAKVPTTTTVNGHALGGNVVVSASDVTTGTLPHAQLPALVSGDIPNNAANTSGTSAGLTGTPAISVASVTVSGSCTGKYALADGTGCGTPSGTLPGSTDTFNTTQTNSSGVGSALLSTASGTWEAVQNGGASNTGAVDASTILNAKTTAACAGSTPTRIHLAAGTYNVNSGWTISATNTTCKNLVIEGDGSGNTILQSTCAGANKYVLAFIDTTSPAAEHFNGPTFRHLTIRNAGGTACTIGLLVSQAAVFKAEDLTISGFAGQTYATGTISSTGSTVNCAGCTFTAAMVHGFIETTSSNTTTRAEVCAFVSGTQVTLCDSTFPTGNIGAGTAFALPYGGAGFVCDPGAGISSGPFTQYATIKDVYSVGNLIGIQAWGVNSGGCSRVQVSGNAGYISPSPGSRVTDAVGIFLGHNSDTWEISAPLNNNAVCIVNDSGHTNWLNGAKCENGGSFAPVTTCNGGVGIQACTAAWEVSSDSNSNGWSTTITNAYAYKVGNVYQYDNLAGAYQASILGTRDLGGQYTQHYTWPSGTAVDSSGCPLNGSGVNAQILTYDCNYRTQATNGPASNVTITTGASATVAAGSGNYYNQDATAAAAITYTLPAPAVGSQFCFKNSYNGSAADTGTLEILVANTGTQSIIFNGAQSASGFIQSSGAAGDSACVVGISTTKWEAYIQVGTWTLH